MKPEARPGWILADIGNSRVKLAWLAGGASAVDRLFEESGKGWDERLTLPTERLAEQKDALGGWLGGKVIAGVWVASVHPEATQRLVQLMDEVLSAYEGADADGAVLASALDVDVPNRLDFPERTGVDRALAVRAALRLNARTGPGIVVLCGTAMTVERVDSEGVWLGGAIAPGYRLAARALHQGTAGLMQVGPISQPPLAHGAETKSAIEAGLFWGQVGAARELVARSVQGDYWEIWSGGDAHQFAPWAAGEQARVIDDLVLLGLADFAAASTSANEDDRL